MTEPDEALLYAREQMADDLQQNGGSAEDVAAARAGAFDTLLKVPATFYRAGSAASAERIKALEAALREAADGLEAEIKARAGNDLPRRVERDLEPVSRARALLKEPRND